ncbi:recombinase family protein [Methylococcus sp. EFPC2]|uniref:recombinase family protein n=1 Tax=Methylococcus sp. EFPC2 TaxID=2812648 RepID=UPI00196864F4|nr:recombinase family protein [Methylococcus sp. EFPC2]QSA97114.1 recombinase family protein [Methylococcus sp. EFPC2]
MTSVGYIRVSSFDQNTDRQLAGIALDKVFEEKASAKDAKRPQLQACIDFLRDGDTLHVHSIDRMARNLVDLQTIVDGLTKKGVMVRFHKENLQFGGQDGALQTLMFQMMGAFAQFERALIRERQREGIAAAKAKGKHVGAPSKLTPETVAEIRQKLNQGANKKALAAEYGISRTTLYAALESR